jgi:hypothetical protein
VQAFHVRVEDSPEAQEEFSRSAGEYAHLELDHSNNQFPAGQSHAYVVPPRERDANLHHPDDRRAPRTTNVTEISTAGPARAYAVPPREREPSLVPSALLFVLMFFVLGIHFAPSAAVTICSIMMSMMHAPFSALQLHFWGYVETINEAIEITAESWTCTVRRACSAWKTLLTASFYLVLLIAVLTSLVGASAVASDVRYDDRFEPIDIPYTFDSPGVFFLDRALVNPPPFPPERFASAAIRLSSNSPQQQSASAAIRLSSNSPQQQLASTAVRLSSNSPQQQSHQSAPGQPEQSANIRTALDRPQAEHLGSTRAQRTRTHSDWPHPDIARTHLGPTRTK